MTIEQHLDGIPLWDGERLHGPSRITWSGDRILEVRESASRHPELAVIPGLIDTHVHLGYPAGEPARDAATWPLITPAEERSLHLAANAIRCARAGVTTLRDLAADSIQLAVGRAFDAGILTGPRLLSHGQVGMTAGHGDLFVPPHYPHRPPTADSPDECRKLVRTWARAGASGVKIYTSGGVLSMGDKVGWRNQTREEIATTVDEAHALQLLVAAHTHSAEGLDIALAEGVDSIEHGTAIAERHLPALVERNLPVAPTLLINDIIAEARRPVSAEAQAKAREVVALRDAGFAAAAQAGVRFVLGTDASGQFVQFGDQMEEVRTMASMFGWSAERTLASATSDAADAIGLGEVTGRLRTGLGSDFVLLRGRPWEDIDALRVENIVAVVSRGVLIAGQLPD
ncbi:amidohydrolase family protein [Cellulomonas denverensis]|uniref:Amidohydrolase family protein n=1 Tax=Cellulomonas denverensis TaxID=264297 RepID=A0A7X6QZ34_9CELL|nr:amidohydrolase family protein [Cellulomonas denverensis]NKY22646.1 amidohydrolase family protein [Cellulomonas denverensis]GIG24706.1 Xaa-Pro dipeptidase [Cellulomonas denverensis]